MALTIFFLILGFILLIIASDKFTDNGIKIAYIFNIPPLIIGLLIFGFGTSAPELLVSSIAAYNGNINISIGNALGSNIINIALVLGVSVLISPIKVSGSILKKEWLLLIIATIVSYVLLLDYYISRIDGFILLTLLPIMLFISIRKSQQSNTIIDTPDKYSITNKNQYIIWLKLLLSLAVLIASAKLIVWSGINLAKYLGISELIIGLTVIAFGTSLPELAISISAAIKKQHSMIMGNIIGSNLFNTLAVLALPGIIHPNYIDRSLLSRDYPIIFVLTILLFLVSYKFHKRHTINRLEGGLLLLVFVYYINSLL